MGTLPENRTREGDPVRWTNRYRGGQFRNMLQFGHHPQKSSDLAKITRYRLIQQQDSLTSLRDPGSQFIQRTIPDANLIVPAPVGFVEAARHHRHNTLNTSAQIEKVMVEFIPFREHLLVGHLHVPPDNLFIVPTRSAFAITLPASLLFVDQTVSSLWSILMAREGSRPEGIEQTPDAGGQATAKHGSQSAAGNGECSFEFDPQHDAADCTTDGPADSHD